MSKSSTEGGVSLKDLRKEIKIAGKEQEALKISKSR